MQKRKKLILIVLAVLVVIGTIAGCILLNKNKTGDTDKIGSGSSSTSSEVSQTSDGIAITLNTPEHGSVSFSDSDETTKTFNAGDTVELTVIPDTGYEAVSAKIGETDLDIETTALSSQEWTSDSFMAEGSVTFEAETSGDISVTFKEVEYDNFESQQLVVVAEDASVFKDEPVTATYGNMYVLEYDSEDATEEAYNKYKDKVTAIEPDTSVLAADTAGSTDSEVTTANAIDALNNVDSSSAAKTDGVIALIDTGVEAGGNVIDSVSVIDDKTAGGEHGKLMVEKITSQNKNAKILSIRALDDEGVGTISSILAAMEYAIEQKVDIINLSLYARATTTTSVLKNEIDKAVSAGILVIGAAGNDGADVNDYVPGNVESAYIIGASDDNGFRKVTSNYGDTIDYYTAADSTSEAAALFTGFISANGLSGIDAVVNKELIFTTDHQIDFLDFAEGEFEDGKPVTVDSNENVKVTVTDIETGIYHIYHVTDGDNQITVPDKDSVHIDICIEDEVHAVSSVKAMDLNGDEISISDTNVTCDAMEDEHMHRNMFFDVSGKKLSSLSVTVQEEEYVPVYDEISGECYYEGMLCGPSCLQDHVRLHKEPVSVDETSEEDDEVFTAAKDITYNGQEYTVEVGKVFKYTDSKMCEIYNASEAHESARFTVRFTGGILKSDTKYGPTIMKCMKHGAAAYGHQSGWVKAYYKATVTKITSSAVTFKVVCSFDSSCLNKKKTGSNYQNVSGTVKIPIDDSDPGNMILRKYPSNSTIYNASFDYELSGAVYSIYQLDSSGKEINKQTVTTNDDGKASLDGLEEGIYYAKELTAPPGYEVNGTVKQFEIKEDKTTKVYFSDTSEREKMITYTPDLFIRKKIDATKTNSGKLADGQRIGNVNLGGIRFALYFYGDSSLTINDKKYLVDDDDDVDDDNSISPDESCIFITDTSGKLYFDQSHMETGDSWDFGYSNGTCILPIGTYIVEELEANPGLTCSNESYMFTVTQDGTKYSTKVTLLGDNWPKDASDDVEGDNVYNPVWTGGVKVYKQEIDRKNNPHEYDTMPQGDGTLAGITYSIYNMSANEVVVNGNTIGVGAKVMDITTQKHTENGVEVYYAESGTILPYGNYRIEETSGNDYYTVNEWSQDFSIDSDGKVVTFKNESYDPIRRGGLAILKVDDDTGRSEPQGDAAFENVTYQIKNMSTYAVLIDGKWYDPNQNIMTISTEFYEGGTLHYGSNSLTTDAYVACTGDGTENRFPMGTYLVTEITSSVGYNMPTNGYSVSVSITPSNRWPLCGQKNANPVKRGGVEIGKVDNDWDVSESQGDGDLSGAEFTVYNRSERSIVAYIGTTKKEIPKDGVVCTLTTVWNETYKQYVATSNTNCFPYGTYEVVETKAPTGYLVTKDGKQWSKTFKIRTDGQIISYIDHPEHVENPVMRGGIIVGKVTREIGQYIELGETTLENSTFKIVNKSLHSVYVNGVTYPSNNEEAKKYVKSTDKYNRYTSNIEEAVCFTMATEKMEWNGRTIFAAYTGNYVLPYGTYDIYEVKTGTGLLFDTPSQTWIKTVSIRKDGQIIDLTDEGDHNADNHKSAEIGDTIANQPIREDFHFQKKSQNTQDRMANVPFLVTSLTTGEKHIIVTDENGTWGSASTHYETTDATQSGYRDHTQNTNANDPDSPISNGAVKIDSDGNWYVADSSKLDSEAGTWFVGLGENSEVQPVWKKDSDGNAYYMINDGIYYPDDDMRAFPYDRYLVEELRADSNTDYNLITFHVTLHSYTKDHDGLGINLDYGTVFDQMITMDTYLTFNSTAKTIPNSPDVDLTDMVTISGLSSGKYTLKSQLWLVSEDGKTAEKKAAETTTSFKISGAWTVRTIGFNLDTTEYGGRTLVCYEYLYDESGKLLFSHEDVEDEDQQVKVIDIHTTLTGVLDHMDYGTEDIIELPDVVTYDGLDPGRKYTITGELMNKSTGEPVLDGDGKKITAEVDFTPTDSSGTVTVVFRFSGVNLKGESVVAFETIERKNIEYAVHANINDDDQTVWYPDINTNAASGADGTKQLPEEAGQEIVDSIHLTNILDGYQYKMVGELHVRNKKGEDEGVITKKVEVKSEDSDETTTEEVTLTAETTWEGDGADQTMTFTGVNASSLGGKDIVVFENLYGRKSDDDEWVLIGTHEDISDDDQAVYVPHIGTTALTDAGIHEYQITEEDNMLTITDRVKYENLIPGLEYTLDGTLHLKSTDEEGNVIDAGIVTDTEGNPVTGTLLGKADDTEESDDTEDTEGTEDTEEASGPKVTGDLTFIPSEADGYVDMAFTFDASILNRYKTGYEEADDETSAATGSAVTASAVSVSGSAVEAETKIEVDVLTTVAFEKLSIESVVVAVHEEIEDEGQSIHFVDIGTTAHTEDGLQEIQVGLNDTTKVVLTDTVAYENLVPGVEYTVTGTLHIQDVDEDGNLIDGGTVTDKKGNDVTSKLTFTPKEANGTVEMPFVFDASELVGKTIVVYESMARDGVTFAVHADITDEGQSIYFVDLHTTAVTEDNLHETYVPTGSDKTVTITDTVYYENLIPGKEYKVDGTLHIQSTSTDEDGNTVTADGGALTDASGETVTASATFTPEKADGSIDLTFTFDASELEGRTIVAFEDLSRDGIKIASHADITDEDQAIHFIKIRTSAALKDDKKSVQVPSDGDIDIVITDTVTYENLIPGLEYTMCGTLHMQTTDENGNIVDGGEIRDHYGHAVAADVDFVPEGSNGKVKVAFTVSTEDFSGGTIVVYETLVHKGVTVAEHSDITDKAQAILVIPAEEQETETPDDDTTTTTTKKKTKKTQTEATPTPSPTTETSTKTPTIWETVKTGQTLFLLLTLLGLLLMSGGGYLFLTKTEKGRRMLAAIKALFTKD